jgi:broad specificity phosphatase PhoE
VAELLLVRHAQASFGAVDYDQLSSIGVHQSRRLGQHFAAQEVRFDHVFCGTMQRHRQTTQGIMTEMKQDQAVNELQGLNEFDFEALYRAASLQQPELKAWSQGSRKEFFVGLKRALVLWSEGRIDAPVPERWDEFQARVESARQYLQERTNGRVLVVSSGGVIGAWTQQVLDAPASAAIELNLQILNSSLSRFFFNTKRMALASFNHLPHLDEKLDQDLVTYG